MGVHFKTESQLFKGKKKKKKSLLFFGLMQMVHDKVAGWSRMNGWKGWFTRASLRQISASACALP